MFLNNIMAMSINPSTEVNREIRYSEAVKSSIEGAPSIRYVQLNPITTNQSSINGTTITFRLSAPHGFIDTTQLEALYDITATFTNAGGKNAFLESAAAPFRQIVVRSVGGQELARVNHYNKLNNILRRLKVNNPAGMCREATSLDNGLIATAADRILSGEFAETTNQHYDIPAAGGTVSVAMGLRGFGVLSTNGSPENNKFFPLCFAPLEIDFVLEPNPSEIFRVAVGTSDITTCTLSNFRLKLPIIDYDPGFVERMRQGVMAKATQMGVSPSIYLNSLRWFVQGYNSNATNFNANVGQQAKSVRSLLLFNDRPSEVNNASYLHLSTSPYNQLTQFYININNTQFPQIPLKNDLEVYDALADSVGGLTGTVNLAKWLSNVTNASSLMLGSASYDAAQNSPSCWAAGLNLDSVPSSAYEAGKATGSQQIQVVATRGSSEERTMYVGVLYDVVNRIDLSTLTVSQEQ